MHGLDLTPRRTRGLLWLLNLGLLVPLVSLGGTLLWGSPAVDAFDNREVHSTYARERDTNLRWKPTLPVDEQALKDTILRPDYERRTPRHFIFCGPPPPPPGPAPGLEPRDTPEPVLRDLERLGRVRLLLDTPGGRDGLLFTFFEPADRTRAFCRGDFIRASESHPARFRLLDVVAITRGVMEIRYKLVGAEEGPDAQRVLVFRHSSVDAPPSDFLGPVPARRVGPKAPEQDPVRRLVLEPRVIRNPRNSRDRVVELTAASHAHFRGRSLFQLTEFIKTQPAVDPQSGAVIGLLFSGLDPKLHADVFDIRRGDILVSLDGREATTRAGFIEIAKELDPDKLIPVEIERNGVRYTYRINMRDPHTIRRFGQSGYFQSGHFQDGK